MVLPAKLLCWRPPRGSAGPRWGYWLGSVPGGVMAGCLGPRDPLDATGRLIMSHMQNQVGGFFTVVWARLHTSRTPCPAGLSQHQAVQQTQAFPHAGFQQQLLPNWAGGGAVEDPLAEASGGAGGGAVGSERRAAPPGLRSLRTFFCKSRSTVHTGQFDTPADTLQPCALLLALTTPPHRPHPTPTAGICGVSGAVPGPGAAAADRAARQPAGQGGAHGG